MPPPANLFVSYASDAGEWVEKITSLLLRPGSQVDSAPVGTYGDSENEREAWRTRGYAGVVVLLTPGYMETQGRDIAAFIKDGRPLVPIYGIHLQPTLLRDRWWLWAVDVMPSESTAVLNTEHPDSLLEQITEQIGGKVDAFQAERWAGATAPSARPVAAETGPDASGSLEQLLVQYRAFGSVVAVIRRAAEYAAAASPPAELSTSLVLLAFAELGSVTPAPLWAADWLRTQMGNAYDGVRRGYFEAKRIPFEFRPGGRPGRLRPGLQLALGRARDLARRTNITGNDQIRARHLLVALLSDTRPQAGAIKQLRRAGLDPAAMLRDLHDFVRGYGDDDAAWGEILLGAAPREERLSGFNADDGRGSEDFLGVRGDVEAFAKLVAARTVIPPLSIGLFGEWGSGKTFFMRMLQKEVRRLTGAMQGADRMQRDLPYWKRIIQIEFNAWHYVEENLWASLANRIFEALHDAERRSVSWSFRERLEVQRDHEASRAQQAEHDKQAAEQEVASAEQELRDAQRRFAELSAQVTTPSGRSLLAAVDGAAVRKAVAGPLQALNFVQVQGSAAELVQELSSARRELSGLGRVLSPLRHGTPSERGYRAVQLLVGVLGAAAVALLLALVLDWMGSENMARIAGWATGAAGVIGAATAWIRRQLPLIRTWRTAVEEAEQRLNACLVEEYDHLRGAETRHDQRQAEAQAARLLVEEARTAVAQAEARLRSASLAEELTRFVTERCDSGEYRKQLGTIARVREDFERLSELIEEENWRLVHPLPGEDVSRRGLKKFETLEEESGDRGARVNRIVLYIDDLDRCPPAKVVEVLQAVHLLLAFPLFVVVVGVDARWVVRSVETRYRELLRAGEGGREHGRVENDFPTLFGAATAHDYLEKIFQVPFWLRTMTDRACKDMVRGLLAPGTPGTQASETAAGNQPPATDVDLATPPPDPAPATSTTGASPAAQPLSPAVSASPQPPSGTPADVPAADAAGSLAEGSASPPVAATPAITDDAGIAARDGVTDEAEAAAGDEAEELSPEALLIHPEEITAIEDLAPLLGRSPRALKRFVNVYRLIKASLTPYEMQGWMARPAFLNASALPDYQAVLFLLAVDTGAPAAAPAIFRAIRELSAPLFFRVPEEMRLTQRDVISNQRDAPIPTLQTLLERLDNDPETRHEPDWARVRQWMVGEKEVYHLPDDLGRLGRWVPRVSRYSFHTGRVGRLLTGTVTPEKANP
ncbi:MAG TPA: P-loop NTPase fold protein [Longimicrobium sp.]|nr:P-loop NTPase fold protein [Longimicrobium sp.]